VGAANTLAANKTAETGRIESIIAKAFPAVDAYRYNSASIRVRIVDESFRGKSKAERERMVEPFLGTLPDKTQRDITILLLLAPEETTTSLMNLEFEHPTPSQL
jgi:stress-induced morphogen